MKRRSNEEIEKEEKRRRVTDKNRLSIVRPDISEEWDYKLNDDSPSNVPYACNEKRWWLCPIGHDSYFSRINHRTNMGSGCPTCALLKKGSTLRRSYDEIKEIVNNLGYILLKEYKGKYGRKVIIQDEFGYKYDVALSHLMSSDRSISFVDKGNPFSLENISLWLKNEEKLFELCDENEYKGAHSKLLFHCLVSECGEVFDMNWGNLYQGYGCSFCSGGKPSYKNKLSVVRPDIASEWDSILNTDTPDSISYGSGKKRWWICPKGHDSYYMTVDHRTRGDGKGQGCPVCSLISLSKGEDSISEWLNYNNIMNIYHKSFGNCRNILPLPFDFGIPYPDGTWLLIEYHGKQHYEPVDFAGNGVQWAKSEFKKNKKRDKIKEKYCKDNNIPLLIIPYWDFDNIENILERTFFE